jgi:hypothetical protein
MPRDHQPIPLRPATDRSRLLYCADINALSDPDYLIEDFLPDQGVFIVYGQPGSKKGFVVLDIALTVGALTADEVKRGIKLPWHGRDVDHGAVVYVWSEGQSGIKKRVTAWRQMRQRLHVGHSLAIIDTPVNLRDPASIDALTEDVAETSDALGLPVKLIILDTIARCSGNANINAPGEMSELVDGLERLKTKTGAVVLGVHHEGKEASRGMMGATTLKGAIDAEFKVTSDGQIVTVEGGKTKDDAPADLSFETRVVDVVDPVTRQPMLTKKGKRVTTLTLETTDKPATRPSAPKLSDTQANARQAFLNWLIDHEAKSMPLDQWTPVLTSGGIVDDRKRAKEVRDALDRKGLIRIEKEMIHVGREL